MGFPPLARSLDDMDLVKTREDVLTQGEQVSNDTSSTYKSSGFCLPGSSKTEGHFEFWLLCCQGKGEVQYCLGVLYTWAPAGNYLRMPKTCRLYSFVLNTLRILFRQRGSNVQTGSNVQRREKSWPVSCNFTVIYYRREELASPL